MTDRIRIIALRTVSGVQIQIQQTDENGNGFGHRLAGGKHYNQPTTTLAERDLDADDAREIRSMLDAAFPTADAEVVIEYGIDDGDGGVDRLGVMPRDEADARLRAEQVVWDELTLTLVERTVTTAAWTATETAGA